MVLKSSVQKVWIILSVICWYGLTVWDFGDLLSFFGGGYFWGSLEYGSDLLKSVFNLFKEDLFLDYLLTVFAADIHSLVFLIF